jgi:predicted nucleic acid-binding protein
MTNENHIFIDTNVLIGAYAGIQNDKNCLQYLYSLTGKRLFISALSIAQFVSVFQKQKTNAEIKNMVNYLINKFIVVDFSAKDIPDALNYDLSDIEDCIQYVISSKFHCHFFITNNKKDYVHFLDLVVFKPTQIRSINQ